MLKVENVETYGWEAAIRGMRNPMNSWEKSDTIWVDEDGDYTDINGNHGPYYSEEDVCDDYHFDSYYSGMKIGPNDEKLMKDLCKGGPVHAKFRRMLTITVDITAPLYWWKEFDTYKVGTVANSCSTMHKIHAKEFKLDDFSCEHLFATEKYDDRAERYIFAEVTVHGEVNYYSPKYFIQMTCSILNYYRRLFLETKDKSYWWQMIQLLPSSYNQKRTVQLNYEVAHNIYISRKDHKLDEWHTLCDALKKLPMSELITMEDK
jgi:hypothetical protein